MEQGNIWSNLWFCIDTVMFLVYIKDLMDDRPNSCSNILADVIILRLVQNVESGRVVQDVDKLLKQSIVKEGIRCRQMVT